MPHAILHFTKDLAGVEARLVWILIPSKMLILVVPVGETVSRQYALSSQIIAKFLDSSCPLADEGVLLWVTRLPEKLLSLPPRITVEHSGTMVWPGS